jgi:hypothetical protein
MFMSNWDNGMFHPLVRLVTAPSVQDHFCSFGQVFAPWYHRFHHFDEYISEIAPDRSTCCHNPFPSVFSLLIMIAEDDVQTIKKELADDNRDVADLWNDALRKYKGIVGEDLQSKFTSVDAMVQFGTHEMENFHQFRHNQKKVDKLRSLFMANLDYIQKGAQQLIAAATPAFPPAAAIGTALTYMLSVCA